MDIVGTSLDLAAYGKAAAPFAAFCAGAATCFGPCAAPRFVALTGLAPKGNALAKSATMLAFFVGLIGSTTAVALGASAVFRLAPWSNYVYWALALGLAFFGVQTLGSDERDACDHHRSGGSRLSLGGAFLAGASFAFVLSPCCTPVLLSLASLCAASGSHARAVTILAAFAAGHALPLAAAALGAEHVRAFFIRRRAGVPVRIVGGALMLALGGYYAVLA
ncbi:MAG TPA: cytochrome c biogenesis protein CcdA [Candidatus Baltobacteraceae bacterium]|jgi:cytochrome c-type biogenesis protein|nr:cytochrome c biogenesis protein CcdA [Candidatus Baltobacteraceae bacterium]